MFGHNFYQLHDYDSLDILVMVMVTSKIHPKPIDEERDITESWTEFNKVNDHDLDPSSVDEFVDWHNKHRVFQIIRVVAQRIAPDPD